MARDPLRDDTQGHTTEKSTGLAHTKKVPAVAHALPDPMTGFYRAIRGLIGQGRTGLVVHVSAATPDEGASTIAKSIATTAATAGSGRVLLMDGKLPSRSRNSERWLAGATQNAAGGTERPPSTPLAHGEGAVNGLFTGSISNDGQDGGVNPQEIRDAYAALRREYDFVIVDCPPLFERTPYRLGYRCGRPGDPGRSGRATSPGISAEGPRDDRAEGRQAPRCRIQRCQAAYAEVYLPADLRLPRHRRTGEFQQPWRQKSDLPKRAPR
jgi:hypothetical protein